MASKTQTTDASTLLAIEDKQQTQSGEIHTEPMTLEDKQTTESEEMQTELMGIELKEDEAAVEEGRHQLQDGTELCIQIP